MPNTPIVSSIRIVGGLFPSSLLGRLATFDDRLDHLTPAAYGCLPGETLRDAITDAWNRLQRVWASFQAYRATAPATGDALGDTRQRWLLPFFQVLGYTDLERAPAPEIDGKKYTISHMYRQVPIHLIGYRLDLDKRVADTVGVSHSNAHGRVQEFINRSPAHQWGIVSNGLQLRLLRDNASLTRQAYLDVDLETLFDQHSYHDFVQVWLLLHASRFKADQPGEAPIDRWYATGTKEGVRALDRLRDNVQSAIEHLGRGFLTSVGPGNRTLREALAGDRLSAQDYYRELLRTVYRLLFCFVAEDRDVLLLPTATAVQRDRYARWYATSRLRRLAASRAGTPHGDGWKSLQLIFRWLSSETGCPALGVPALGSLLWSGEATPHLDACNLSNQALFAALRSLAVTNDGGVRRPIDFKNLGAEELGGIYESLLELHPELSAESGAFSLKSVAGSERKTTGSYYTPTSLIKCLLDSALDPVVEAAASKPTPAEAEQAILDLTVVDPACGSGHFLVAAAHRIAKRLASVRTGDLEPAPEPVRHALRDVISRCIYGVDLNPMSVELCKVSLWLEAIDPGRPLSFLDHHIRCGNSLIGTTPELVAKGVPDEAFDPITGDDKDSCKQRKKRNKPERCGQNSIFEIIPQSPAVPLDDLRHGDDSTLAGVSRLRQAWQAVENDPAQQRAKWSADAWVVSFLAPKTPGSPTITSEVVRVALQTGPSGLDPQQRVVVQMIAEEYHVFHWHIAFPELFGEGRANGFSVVLGNPPWERIALEDIEYFSGIDDSIASIKNTSRRKQAIQELRKSNSGVYNAYEKKCESSARMAHFFQSCSLYALSSSGRINLYPLFVDLGNRIMQRSGGFSMIIPSGIATDAPLAAFWRAISDDGRLSAFFDFENSHGLFPAVHREMNFSILSLVGKESSAKGSSTFCFRAKSTSDLLNEDYRFNLPSNILSVVSPNTGQPLVCRTRREYEICSSIYRNSVIFRADGESGNRNRCFVGMTSAEYSHLLRSVVESSNDHVPVIEAKMIGQYNLYLGGFDPQPGNREDWTRTEYVLSHDRESPPLRPRHVVERDVADQFYRDMEIRLPYYAGIRDVTNINNERTAISAILPRLPILQPLNGILCESPEQLVYVVAMINSKAVDFIARRRFTGRHLNVTTTNQLPIPRLDKNDLQCVVRAAFRLSYSTNMLDQLAHDLGYTDKPGILEPDDRDKLLDTIDALVFKACRLKRDDIEYILDTFDVLRDREIQRYGIYRSKLSILNIIDHQDREPSHA